MKKFGKFQYIELFTTSRTSTNTLFKTWDNFTFLLCIVFVLFIYYVERDLTKMNQNKSSLITEWSTGHAIQESYFILNSSITNSKTMYVFKEFNNSYQMDIIYLNWKYGLPRNEKVAVYTFLFWPFFLKD